MTGYSVVVLILVLIYKDTIKVNAEIAETALVRQIATKDVKHPASVKKERVHGNGCGCKNYSCGCCAHLDVEKIGLNDTVCINMTYLPDQYGVSLTISVDNVIYYNKTISAKNPPPVCAAVPYLKEYASLCVEFRNLTLNTSSLTGCVLIVAELEHVVVKEYKIGCFKIPPGRNIVYKKYGHNTELQDMNYPVSVKNSDRGTGCGCGKFNCGCCAHLQVEEIGLNDTVCGNITYLPNVYGVSVTVSVNGVIYFNYTVSAKNPPPFCFGVPYLKKLASLCVRFYNLTFTASRITGCVLVNAILDGRVIETFKLGCFKIPLEDFQEIGLYKQMKDKALQAPVMPVARQQTTSCSCLYYDCGCCMDLADSIVSLGTGADTVCANLTFLDKTSEVIVIFTMDKVVFYKKTIPLRNPPPVCFNLPDLSGLELCVQLYNWDIKEASLTGCLRVLTKIADKVVESFTLGCFKFPFLVTQTSSRPLLFRNGHPSQLKNLIFLADQDAQRNKMVDRL